MSRPENLNSHDDFSFYLEVLMRSGCSILVLCLVLTTVSLVVGDEGNNETAVTATYGDRMATQPIYIDFSREMICTSQISVSESEDKSTHLGSGCLVTLSNDQLQRIRYPFYFSLVEPERMETRGYLGLATQTIPFYQTVRDAIALQVAGNILEDERVWINFPKEPLSDGQELVSVVVDRPNPPRGSRRIQGYINPDFIEPLRFSGNVDS